MSKTLQEHQKFETKTSSKYIQYPQKYLLVPTFLTGYIYMYNTDKNATGVDKELSIRTLMHLKFCQLFMLNDSEQLVD